MSAESKKPPSAVERDAEPTVPSTRAGFAAIVGRPNVGKSTLLNALLGEKLAIVSNRPQTTRNRVLGVQTAESDQVVFVDTPGIHKSRANLNRFMVQEALTALDGVDCVILVTEVERGSIKVHAEDLYVLQQIQQHRHDSERKDDVIVVLNKIDRIGERAGLLPLIKAWSDDGFTRVVPTAAIRNDGVQRLMKDVRASMPAGPHLYPEDMLTDRAERFLAAELIREQIFKNCRQELPYSTAVEVTKFEERRSQGDITIEATIHVERDGQKAIIIGKKGSMIREIGTYARKAIGALLHCEVHVRLQVHVQPDWTSSPAARRRFGYE